MATSHSRGVVTSCYDCDLRPGGVGLRILFKLARPTWPGTAVRTSTNENPDD